MNREAESTAMRPLAKALTKSLENVRNLLREACLRNNTPNGPLKLKNNELITDMLLESLKIFDRLFAEFELHYVSAMVPVKTTQEYELQEMIGVLFSETLQRALKMRLLTQDMVDDCDPALMFTIPRLAIVSGLLIYPDGPLCIDKSVEEMSEMFRPFRTLLHKIRELLWTLEKRELYMLEKLLCDNEQCSDIKSVSDIGNNSDLDEFVNRFYNDYPICKDFISNFYSVSVSNGQEEHCEEAIEDKHVSPRRSIACEINNTEPSTSGYILTNTVEHDSIIASITNHDSREFQHPDSLPEPNSLEIISEAAATLSTILTRNSSKHSLNVKMGSPNDSGVSTENTSLDRSPSIELNDGKNCHCYKSRVRNDTCGCFSQRNSHKVKKSFSGQVGCSPFTKQSKMCVRKRLHCVNHRENSSSDDSSSLDSSDTSSFNSTCADDEEIALAMQAAEIADRNAVRAKFR